MRIAMILENPLFFGGGENHAYELSKRLIQLGHRVDFVQMYGTPRKRQLRKNEPLSPSHWIPQPKSQLFGALYTRALWQYSYLALPMIYKRLLEGKYDVLHVHGFGYASPILSAILAKKARAGAKIVCTLHNDLARHIDRKLIRLSTPYIDASIAVSRTIQQRWLNYYGQKSFYIPNGVDTFRFNPKVDGFRMRKELGIQDKFVVLYVGRLSLQKGLKYLIQAASLLKDEMENLVVLICGRGEQENNLKKLVKDARLEEAVKFPGFISPALLPEFYAACDVFVLPSIFETFALTILEALSVGKPVVTSKVGGAAELVQEFADTCRAKIVSPKSPSEIAKAISWYFNHKEDSYAVENASVCSKYIEEKFSWEKIATQTAAIYEMLQ